MRASLFGSEDTCHAHMCTRVCVYLQKLRATLESELPLEPQDTDSGDVTVMRFRPPGAEPFKRAFKLDTALQVRLSSV